MLSEDPDQTAANCHSADTHLRHHQVLFQVVAKSRTFLPDGKANPWKFSMGRRTTRTYNIDLMDLFKL